MCERISCVYTQIQSQTRKYPGIWAIADQGVLGLTSMLIGATFVLRGTPKAYGAYTGAVSALLLLTSAQNAILATPLNVMYSRLSVRAGTRLRNGMFGALVLGAPLWWISGAIALMPMLGSAFSPLGVAGCAACFLPILLREFGRADEFACLQPFKALRIDTVYAVVGLAAVALCVKTDRLDAEHVMAATGLACAAASALFLFDERMPRVCVRDLTFAGKTIGGYSTWSLLGATASWIQANAYVGMTASMFGAEAVAAITAPRLLFSPVLVILQGIGNYLRPAASTLIAEGKIGSAIRVAGTCCALLLTGLICYVVSVASLVSAYSSLIPGFYTDAAAPFVWLWGAIAAVQIVRLNASYVLQGAVEFRYLAAGSIVGAVVTSVGTALSGRVFGPAGALVSLLASELLLAVAFVAKVAVAYYSWPASAGRSTRASSWRLLPNLSRDRGDCA